MRRGGAARRSFRGRREGRGSCSGHRLRQLLRIAGGRRQVHPKKVAKKINKPSTIRRRMQAIRNSGCTRNCRGPYWLGLSWANPQNVVGEFTYHYYVLQDKTLSLFSTG